MDQDAASIAFSKGKVDAWVSWDPIVAQVQLKEKVKLLINGNQAKAYNRIYTVSPTKFAKSHQALSKLIIKYIQQDMNWENSHPKKLARLLSKELKISNQAASLIVSRRKFGMYKMTKKYVKEEQQLAKAFYLNDVISKEPQIADQTDYLK